MKFSDKEIVREVTRRNPRAVSRLISLLEDGVPRARKIHATLFKRTGRAHLIGVTGSPGAGKSTLVDKLASYWEEKGRAVGIIAVDPSSPFSGGAILGDRIRMDHASERKNTFIRSMATRGALGGVARSTLDAVQVLDAAGYDPIIIETVGVGQAEVDIARTAHTCVVVLVPGMGDSVQIFKAGILEIADAFVINKADREGADLVHRDLRSLLSLEEKNEGWKPSILETVATKGDGIEKVALSLESHKQWLDTSILGKRKKSTIIGETILKIASEAALHGLRTVSGGLLERMVRDVESGKRDPLQCAQSLLRTWKRG